MLALIRKAIINAPVESMVANLIALRLPASVRSKLRVCTMLECRYRLCGITVAPKMPIARYNADGLNTICGEGNRHFGRHSDAAQPVPAFEHRADTQL